MYTPLRAHNAIRNFFNRRTDSQLAIYIWVLSTLSLIIFAYLSFLIGFQVGRDQYRDSSATLPVCQEDEVLYPASDYKGPGNNKPSEYACFNIDDMITPEIVDRVHTELQDKAVEESSN